MTLPNHLAGGYFITGITTAFLGISIFSVEALIVTAVAAVLPDIDHTKSPVGKVIPALSRYLNRRHGHRNLTHSALAVLVLTLVFSTLETLIAATTELSTIFLIAYSSHILLDMCTLQGVGLFYPFARNMAVLPGNPKMRIRTGNPKTEALIFSCFIIGSISLFPFMKKGFWTSYNQTFGTPSHLVSEQRKSEDALLVEWRIKKGSETERGSGILVDASQSHVTLIDEKTGYFRHLNDTEMVIVNLLPIHTGRDLFYKDFSFVSISADSLNHLLIAKYLTNIDIQGNQKFLFRDLVTSKIQETYIINPQVRAIANTTAIAEFQFSGSPKIATLERKITKLERAARKAEQEAATTATTIANRRAAIQMETDLIKRESMTAALKELEGKSPSFIDYETRITDASNELREVRMLDQQKRSEQLRAYELEVQANQVKPLEFTGVLHYVEIGKVK